MNAKSVVERERQLEKQSVHVSINVKLSERWRSNWHDGIRGTFTFGFLAMSFLTHDDVAVGALQKRSPNHLPFGRRQAMAHLPVDRLRRGQQDHLPVNARLSTLRQVLNLMIGLFDVEFRRRCARPFLRWLLRLRLLEVSRDEMGAVEGSVEGLAMAVEEVRWVGADDCCHDNHLCKWVGVSVCACVRREE